MVMDNISEKQIKDFCASFVCDRERTGGNDVQLPRITIVTPSFNQGPYLERTILSVLNQNYPNLEYIIMDGASSDGSVEIIRKYEKYLAYWSSEKDEGQAHAIRKGFSRATGQILAYLNSDDIYLPNILRSVANCFLENPTVSFVYGNKVIIDSNDFIVSERRVTGFNRLSRLGLVYGGFGFYQPASFWTKMIYDSTKGIDVSLKFCMDNDLFYQFMNTGCEFRFLRQYLAGFRVHKSSKTSTLMRIAETEKALLIKRYALREKSPLARYVWFLIRLHRAMLYVLQGDANYLYFKLFKDKYKWVP